MNEIVFASACNLAAAISQKRVSAVEVLEAHLARIAEHNPILNAIITLDAEGARQRAQEADAALTRGDLWGPLHGVPFTLKDGHSTAGMRTTAGFPPLADYIPKVDSTVAGRLKAAGAILLGKTNVPPLLSQPQSDNPIFGRTNNPWKLDRTPGGSSGGACAAVAAGLTPLDIGSDLAGSIRIPSHFCGVYGLKPTARRVSVAGHIPDLPGAPRFDRWLATIGPIARTVDDLTLALRLIAGPDGRDTEVPPVPLHDPPTVRLAGLRIALAPTFPGVPVAAAIRQVVTRVARDLERCGAYVAEALPTMSFEAQHAVWAEVYERFDYVASQVWGALPSGRRDPPTFLDELHMLERRDAIVQTWDQFLAEWDVLLCPAAPVTAFPHCVPGADLSLDGTPMPYGQISHHAFPFNLSGHPTITLPAARDAAGLPIGVQIVGPRWGEERLLAIAAQVAEVTGAFQWPPALTGRAQAVAGAAQ
jgi:amidase